VIRILQVYNYLKAYQVLESILFDDDKFINT
jgi:hypothetical protein